MQDDISTLHHNPYQSVLFPHGPCDTPLLDGCYLAPGPFVYPCSKPHHSCSSNVTCSHAFFPHVIPAFSSATTCTSSKATGPLTHAICYGHGNEKNMRLPRCLERYICKTLYLTTTNTHLDSTKSTSVIITCEHVRKNGFNIAEL